MPCRHIRLAALRFGQRSLAGSFEFKRARAAEKRRVVGWMPKGEGRHAGESCAACMEVNSGL